MSRYQSAKTTALLMAANMRPGDVDNSQYCPMCEGGPSRDKSFRISVTDTGIWFNCYRLKCKFSGSNKQFIPTTGEIYKPPRPYKLATRALTSSEVSSLDDRYPALCPDSVKEWTYSEIEDRIVVPLRDSYGITWGCEAKKLDVPWVQPSTYKTVMYYNQWPFIKVAWSRNDKSGPVVITEDVVSSQCVADCGFSSAAIIGTSLDRQQVGELAANATELIIALDPDAMDKAISLMEQTRLMFLDGVSVVFFDKDPKDCTKEEIIYMIGGVYGATSAEHGAP